MVELVCLQSSGNFSQLTLTCCTVSKLHAVVLLDFLQSRSRILWSYDSNKLCLRPPQYAPAPCKLTFDLLTLKVVSESCMTWATSVPFESS